MRRLKFSIRLLLFFVTVVAVVLMYLRARIANYEQIGRDVESLDQMGFVVDLQNHDDSYLAGFAPKFKGYPTYIRLYSSSLSGDESDELFEIIERNPSIEKIMTHVDVSDRDAKRFLSLPLDSLGLFETPIGDTLDAKASPTLEWLSFHRTRLNDNSLKSLGTMPMLKYLDLTRTRVSDRSIEYLARLPKLEDVILRRCKVTSEGADRLASLRPDLNVYWEPLSR